MRLLAFVHGSSNKSIQIYVTALDQSTGRIFDPIPKRKTKCLIKTSFCNDLEEH